LLLAGILAVAAPVLIQTPPAGASEPLNGGGSTWSAVAIQQWQSDIARQGFTVNYQPTGSTAGRIGFYQGQYDFAVSEIPFQPKYCSNPADPTTCDNELSHVHRPFLYIPIVAGGTSILYNLQINGQAFKQLHLSPKTLSEIFTGVIKFWDAADIAADNPGVGFPHTAVTPVVRSDGSGTSYQFTAFMSTEQPALWNAFCQSQGIATPCPPTSQFPAPSGYAAQNGSDGVANFVAAPYNNGAIGYAEAAYGLQRGVPLASLKNASGAFVEPTGVNVAVALTKAIINADHTQNLLGVYANPDVRAYPMSSYSYMIVPTAPATSPMDVSKGATLGQFILYFLCQGQQEADPLGYSPLPPNLVELGFSVEQQIPGGPAPPPINKCNNPTITGNYLLAHHIASAATGAVASAGTGAKANASKATTSTATSGAGAAATANQAGATGTTVEAGAPGGSTGDVATGTTLVQATSQNFGKPWRAASLLSVLLVSALVVGLMLGPPTASLLVRRRRSVEAISRE
jgi:phosphate transport system substrate-binding protein